jgi:hypothetical protein
MLSCNFFFVCLRNVDESCTVVCSAYASSALLHTPSLTDSTALKDHIQLVATYYFNVMLLVQRPDTLCGSCIACMCRHLQTANLTACIHIFIQASCWYFLVPFVCVNVFVLSFYRNKELRPLCSAPTPTPSPTFFHTLLQFAPLYVAADWYDFGYAAIMEGAYFNFVPPVRYCATNQKVAGSVLDGVIGIFHWHNPSGSTMALGSAQPLTEMSTRKVSWG